MKRLWLKLRRAVGFPRENLFAVEMEFGTMFNVDVRTAVNFPSLGQKYNVRVMTDDEMDAHA